LGRKNAHGQRGVTKHWFCQGEIVDWDAKSDVQQQYVSPDEFELAK